MSKVVASKTFEHSAPFVTNTYTAKIVEYLDITSDGEDTKKYQVRVFYDGYVIAPRHNRKNQEAGFILGDYNTYSEAYGAMLMETRKRAERRLTPEMFYIYTEEYKQSKGYYED